MVISAPLLYQVFKIASNKTYANGVPSMTDTMANAYSHITLPDLPAWSIKPKGRPRDHAFFPHAKEGFHQKIQKYT